MKEQWKFEHDFFNLQSALNIIDQNINQIREQCKNFTPADITEFPGDDLYDTKLSFETIFKLKKYQAFSMISIHFINDIATDCIINLGCPVNTNHVFSETEVTNIITNKFEMLFNKGKFIQDPDGGKVYTWKKNKKLISYGFYPSNESPNTMFLGIQVRNKETDPAGNKFEQLYNTGKTFLPPEQEKFESAYKNRLFFSGIVFVLWLSVVFNIGRFLYFLFVGSYKIMTISLVWAIISFILWYILDVWAKRHPK